MSLTPTAYVILGLVRVYPRSGYEIKATVDESTRFFWAASYGQIYPELRRLADAGLVEGVDEPRGGRRRTVYSITDSGVAELQAWLRRPPETFETRDEGLLKLFFAGALAPEDATATLRAMRGHHGRQLERLRAIEPKAAAVGGYPLIVLRGGIEFAEFFMDWCERTERQVVAAGVKQEDAVRRGDA